MAKNIMEKLKKEYKGIRRIEKEDGALIIYADDDTLWKIIEDKREEFNMEFEGGIEESHFIRIFV